MADAENAGKGSQGGGEKKLHIDSDWKEQVRAEKEKLDRESREREAAEAANRRKREAGVIGQGAGGAAQAAEDEGASHELPPASMSTLIQSLMTQAMLFLSPERDPETGRTMRNLELAKHTIDLLSVLEAKTKGNLSDDEKRMLDTALYHARMAYVQASRSM